MLSVPAEIPLLPLPAVLFPGTFLPLQLHDDGHRALVRECVDRSEQLGVVLTPAGGALAKLLPLFRLGLGGRVGSGRQWMSWVARDELAGIVEHVLVTDTLVGPVNPVSPNPVRNADFAAIVARVRGRKPGPTMPAFLMHLLLGEMADEFLLASRRMEPRKLLATGYQFRFSELEAALRHELKA